MISALRTTKVGSVIHYAGYGLSGTSNLPAYNDLTTKVNILGTKIVVEACLSTNVKNLGKHYQMFFILPS
jgi:nucleoside-diphosphate-sugar epimerase